MHDIETIYFDLDGTLLDHKKRLYHLFLYLTGLSAEAVPESLYWKWKADGEGQAALLKNRFFYSEHDIRLFAEEWKHQVECETRLEEDSVVEGVIPTLARLKELGLTQYVVTNRQFPDRVCKQLNALSLTKYFSGVLVTQQKTSKAAAIQRGGFYQKNSIMVGDTKEDIHTAQELGIPAIAVSYSIFSEEYLLENGAVSCMRNITELLNLVKG